MQKGCLQDVEAEFRGEAGLAAFRVGSVRDGTGGERAPTLAQSIPTLPSARSAFLFYDVRPFTPSETGIDQNDGHLDFTLNHNRNRIKKNHRVGV